MNQYQIDLIDSPPPKNPYFSLPDTEFFITPEDAAEIERAKHYHASLVELFGNFEKMTDDQQTQFLLTLMKYSSFKPNFEAMASGMNLSSAYSVRRRFVAIAEKQGFETFGDSIKASDEASPRSSKKKTTLKKISTTLNRAGTQNSGDVEQSTIEQHVPDEMFEEIVEDNNRGVQTQVQHAEQVVEDDSAGGL